MAPTQGRMRSSSPRMILATMCGSAMWARVMPTMSSLPLAMAKRAVATSWILAAWKVGKLVAARISPAKSRCGAERIPCTGITSVRPASVSMWPFTTFRKSTMPQSLRRREISSPSALVRPPGSSSSPV